MSSRYIFFNTVSGLVNFIARPTYDELYTDGNVYGTDTAKIWSSEIELDEDILNTYHWTGTIIDIHTAKSTPYSTWNTSTFTWETWIDFTTSNSWNTSTIVADGSSTASFGAALPSGTLVHIETPAGVQPIADITVNDGQIAFSAQQAGNYIFTFTATNYIPYTHTITAS